MTYAVSQVPPGLCKSTVCLLGVLAVLLLFVCCVQGGLLMGFVQVSFDYTAQRWVRAEPIECLLLLQRG